MNLFTRVFGIFSHSFPAILELADSLFSTSNFQVDYLTEIEQAVLPEISKKMLKIKKVEIMDDHFFSWSIHLMLRYCFTGREERGSQTSISQLSSGYQSSSLQARQASSSQSCSPMEISTDASPHNTSKYAANQNRKSYMDSDHASRARLSSSSDSAASGLSTPPRDRRNNFSAAPRTNPHCSQNGSLPVSATPPSPKLGTRAFGDTEKRNKLKCRPVNRRASSSPDRISHDSAGTDRDTKQVKSFDLKFLIFSVFQVFLILQYEVEIEQLRSQLQALQVKLQEAERKLSSQEQTTEKVILDWKAQIEAGEERVKKEQIEKDLQMKSIVVR